MIVFSKYSLNQGVFRQPPNNSCYTTYSDMLTHVHLISYILCDRVSNFDSFLENLTIFKIAIDYSILAFSFRPIPLVFSKASPLAFPSSSTTAAAITIAITMAKNKDNNNDKNKDLDKDEQQRRQQVREERERRRALASMGKADLVVSPPNLQNLFGSANTPAGSASSSATATQRAPHPHPSSAAALDAAAAVPLPDNDDDLDSDQLLASEEETDRDPPPYEEDEDGMDVDDDEPLEIHPKWNVSIIREAPRDGELDVGPSRPWIPASLKDGTKPTNVREIAIQCDYGGASLVRRRRHLIACRRRHDKKRREKSKAEKTSAGEDGQQDPHPDATAQQVSPPQPVANPSTTGSGSGQPHAASRRGGEMPPAKRAKQEAPPKKKEGRKEAGQRFSPVRAPAQEPEKRLQPSSSSGGSCAPKRHVDFHSSVQSKPAPKAGQNRKEEAHRQRYHAPKKRQYSSSNEPRFDSNTAKMIEVFVRGMSEAFRASRGFDRSPSPQPHSSRDYRNGSRHHYHHDDRARFEQEEEEEERGRSGSRRRSRSRSQSRGRSRDRRPPPYRGKGKGRGKGRGK